MWYKGKFTENKRLPLSEFMPAFYRQFICRKGKIQKFFLFLLILCFQTKKFLKLRDLQKINFTEKMKIFIILNTVHQKTHPSKLLRKNSLLNLTDPTLKIWIIFQRTNLLLLNAIKSMRNFIGRVQSLGDTGVAVMITSVTAFVSTSKL